MALPEVVLRTAEDIKALRVQGARNVAKAALDAIIKLLETHPSDIKDSVVSAVKVLAATRPTEPALRDAMTFVLRKLVETEDPDELIAAIRNYEQEMVDAERRIAEIGSRKIPDGGTVITHCHSSTAINVLVEAHRQGKDFKVIVTETRPRYQGKLTARDLLSAGIPVVYVVDSAAYFFMHDADVYLTGADAITSDGYVANKIGTALMAVAARRFDVPYYVAATTLKYDPVTAAGYWEPIEERDPREVIDPSELPGAEIRNPAFDLTPPDLVTGIISEIGIYGPQVFPLMVMQHRHIDPSLEEEIALFRLASGGSQDS